MSGDQNDPVDTVGPWSLKAVPTQTRQAVIRAAQRENLTVGQWLELRVREWTEAGSPVTVSEPQSTGQDLALIERAVTAAVALASAPDVPVAFRRRANRLLRAIDIGLAQRASVSLSGGGLTGCCGRACLDRPQASGLPIVPG
jgi:hypothetical protein